MRGETLHNAQKQAGRGLKSLAVLSFPFFAVAMAVKRLFAAHFMSAYLDLLEALSGFQKIAHKFS